MSVELVLRSSFLLQHRHPPTQEATRLILRVDAYTQSPESEAMARPPDPDAPQTATTEESAARPRKRRRSHSHAAATDRVHEARRTETRPTALLVGIDGSVRDPLSIRLRLEKYEVREAATVRAASAEVETRPYTVVVLGLGHGLIDAEAFVRRSRQLRPNLTLIVLAAHIDNPLAAHYLRLGADEVLRAPIVPRRILQSIARAKEASRPPDSRPPTQRTLMSAVFVGDSAAVRHLRHHFTRVAKTPGLTVFLNGEIGTGKEDLARGIHESDRNSRNFVALRASEIPTHAFRRIMFGGPPGGPDEVKGSENGALPRANGGTLYLDDIDGVPQKQQVQLLRVLEHGRYRPVGSTTDLRFRGRIISATQRPPDPRSRYGLRPELFALLTGAAMHLPPLRTRFEDLPQLVRHFATQAALRWAGEAPQAIDESAHLVLRRHHWPGNLHELRGVIERAMFYGGGLRLTRAATEKALDVCTDDRPFGTPSGHIERAPPPDSSASDFVAQVFESCNHDSDSASSRLGMTTEMLRSHLRGAGLR